LTTLALAAAIMAPATAATAHPSSRCDVGQAVALVARGDRATAGETFTRAARLYAAAAQVTADCRGHAALTHARALALAGSSLARGGDLLDALDVLRSAQADLHALDADPHAAEDARALRTLVENFVAAVERVADASM
jgi:hypothetical protein